MIFKVLLCFCVFASIALPSPECKWYKNWIFYDVVGYSNINGVSSVNAHHCLRRAMAAFENTITGLRLYNAKYGPREDVKIHINFERFVHNNTAPNITLPSASSETTLNCADEGEYEPGRITYQINSAIRMTQNDNARPRTGVDFFTLLCTNWRKHSALKTMMSIVYRVRNNFDYYYQDNLQLNDADRDRLARLYSYNQNRKTDGDGTRIRQIIFICAVSFCHVYLFRKAQD